MPAHIQLTAIGKKQQQLIVFGKQLAGYAKIKIKWLGQAKKGLRRQAVIRSCMWACHHSLAVLFGNGFISSILGNKLK